MKRNILSILLACLMIVSLLVLTGCKVDDLAVKVDENAANAENAVNDAASKADAAVKAAAKKAAEDLAAAEEKLEKFIKDGDAANTADIAAAVKDFNAALAAMDEALTGADAALKAELVADFDAKLTAATKVVEEAAAKAIKDAEADLAAAIAEGDAETVTKLSAAISDVADQLAEIDVAVQDTAIKLDDILKADLTAIIELNAKTAAENLAAVKDELDILVDKVESAAVCIEAEKWNEATEAIVNAVVEISTHFNTKIDKDFYYGEEYAKIVALYEEYKIRLTRAIDTDAVDAVLNAEDGYYAAVEAVDDKADVILAVLTAEGKTVEEVVLNEAWGKAITDAQAMIAAETDADVLEALKDVKDLADKMAARYGDLGGAKVVADAINARVDALIAALAAEGRTVANTAEYEAILEAITAWDTTYGEANEALIVREDVETMKTAAADAVKAYEDAAKALLDKFATYNAADYVFVYTTDYEAVTKLEADYTAWAAAVVAKGYTLEGTVEAPVVAAHKTFAEDTLVRATVLNTANTDATAIETLISTLTEELKNFTIVRSAYQDTLDEIKAKAAAWDKAYFAEPFNAIDGAEKANYELLDHAAITAVEELYVEKMAEVMKLAEDLKAALAKLDTINVFSGADIEAAKAAYTAFTNWLADLKYEIEGLATTDVITNTLATKTVEFKNIAGKVIAEYKTLAVLKAADVKLTSEADVAALKTWFKTYFTVDLTAADAALPVAEIVLDDGTTKLTVNATMVDDAKAALKAFADLTAAKADELAALKAEIEALVAKKPATNLRADVDAVLANYAAWLDGSKVPTGFDKAQFIPVDATVLDTLKADLDALNVAVKALEDAYKALQTRIAALELDYTKIADTAAAKALLDALNADIKAFIATNNDVDCFTEAEKKTLADAQVAVNQAIALADLLEDYNNLIASLAGIADTRVVENMTARAKAALKAAEEAVKANDTAAIELAYANFELFAATVEEYTKAITAAAGDAVKTAKIYEAYVLLDAREDMTSKTQVADEIVIVKATFAAVLA